MSNKTVTAIAFLVGAIGGSITTYFVVKKKYEKIAQEEIDSVKAVYSNKAKTLGSKLSEKVTEVKNAMNNMSKSMEEAASKFKSSIVDSRDVHVDLAENEDMTGNYDVLYADGFSFTKSSQDPYIITGGEFAQDNDYVKMGLIYCDDGSVVYEDGTIASDISSVVGDECAMKIEEANDESIYICDDEKRIDYEIIKGIVPSVLDESEEDYE